MERIKRPILVYKYSGITEYAFDSLRKSVFWCTDHDKLNDPFDCQFKYADSMFEKIGVPKNDRSSFEKLVKKLWGWGLCCFTTENSNHLMWSHYADGHKGFCLEFDTRKCKLLSEKLFPVTYSDEFPIIKEFDEIIPNGVLRKTKKWEYEKEWRLIIGGSGNCHLPYNRRALSSIYFGLNTSAKDLRKVMSICRRSHHRKIKYYRTVKEEDTYSLKHQVLEVD